MKGLIQGVIWVAGVYFYFLIFAQFAFLEVLSARDFAADPLKWIMGAMAVGGIVGSAMVMLLRKMFAWEKVMRVAAVGCAALPILSVMGDSTLGTVGYALIAVCIGLGLGVLTVLLAANLGRIMGRHVYLGAGLGTGLAYMLSNVPWVFQSSPVIQCYLSAIALCLLAFIPLARVEEVVEIRMVKNLSAFPVGVLCFTMLVWLDSAAFYIIQHHQEMKLETWGTPHLWRNALVHLSVAVLSGWLLSRGKIVIVLGTAFALLGVAGSMASQEGMRLVAGYLYPAGVSFYSVALILYPAVWLGQKGSTLRAVVLFAVAGWLGSAMGIGMAQDLHAVPGAFVIVAGALMLAPLAWRSIKFRRREVLVCVAVAVPCLLSALSNQKTPAKSIANSIFHGREIYLSEGCIHCHSRYVRPETRDVLLWGPAGNIEKITQEKPVIIGNRRQGPDLLHVGLRRSKGWMKQHFIDPQSLAPNSSMPSYAYLFKDERGNSLIEFLAAYEADELAKRQHNIYQWQPSAEASAQPAARGHDLFSSHCAVCHGQEGEGGGDLADLWAKPPANLKDGPFAFTFVDDGGEMIARVIKFGIPGTDMPGHELLSDTDVKTLAEYVINLRKNNPN